MECVCIPESVSRRNIQKKSTTSWLERSKQRQERNAGRRHVQSAKRGARQWPPACRRGCRARAPLKANPGFAKYGAGEKMPYTTSEGRASNAGQFGEIVLNALVWVDSRSRESGFEAYAQNCEALRGVTSFIGDKVHQKGITWSNKVEKSSAFRIEGVARVV
ncbi:hypothetical protein LshimejAT787_0504400 [Lyophyllum shimeji]|uniref:Uncharacterized protein n=1 Tax=Lyophyllum shimeji TaxID=47721 RepID=A0A9P3UP42_LYOSH|nr:hypothetical protein LshimejAT787_0504400 [Lyophyllum shimeji]